MCNLRLLFLVAMSTIATSTVTLGGSVRYELSELLGEHVFDGSRAFPFGRNAHVDTPFGFYSVDRATLIVEGTVAPGKARGDGILREALDFDLMPSVGASPSFTHTVIIVPTEPIIGEFRLEQHYPDPFHPAVVPLPNPDGYPPVSFNVTFSVGPSLTTNYPPLLTPPMPGDLIFATDGIIVEEPIVANVTKAYIVLEGPHIVPEPGSVSLIVGLAIATFTYRRLRMSSSWFMR